MLRSDGRTRTRDGAAGGSQSSWKVDLCCSLGNGVEISGGLGLDLPQGLVVALLLPEREHEHGEFAGHKCLGSGVSFQHFPLFCLSVNRAKP